MSKAPASSAYSYPLLIKQLLHASMVTSPQQEIVSGDLCSYDYLTFNSRIEKLAAGLSAIGVKPGDTVAVMNWDCHRYLECFFAVPMMAAILHTVNIRLSPEQLLYTINHAEDDVILVHSDFVDMLAQIRDQIDRPVKLVFIHDQMGAQKDLPDGFDIEYESLLEISGNGFVFEDFDESTIATTFYTTGTTGDPKGVYYSHRQLVLHTMGVIATLSPVDDHVRLCKSDVYMPMTPMFHVHAWGIPYAATMLGLKQVYPRRYEPSKLIRFITDENVTFSHCVPTIMHMLLSAPEANDADLSNLKVVIGGSALPQGLSQICIDKGIQVYTGYGMSETGPIVSAADTTGINHNSTADDDLSIRAKTGKPSPLVELRVVDEQMNDIARGGRETGEVVFRAPWLTQGYSGNPEGSEELWRGGYMHTGDVGYIDETGSLLITDRMKDVIKSGGEWLSSLELENIVSQIEGIGEVAAVGIPDARWGERPLIVVARNTESEIEITIKDIQEAISAHVDSGALPKWAIPERVEFVEAIDKTSVGKLDKKVLRARYS
jgi:fatty-acyl-CoA synthase